MQPATEVLPPVVESPIAEYNEVVAGLAIISAQIKNANYDCTTTAGDEAARKDRQMCVKIRVKLEEKRKEKKAAILERGRLLDGECQRITKIIEELEAIPDAAIKAQEAVVEQRRQAKARADQEARDKQTTRLSNMREFPLKYIGQNIASIDKAIGIVERADLSEFDAVYLPLAQQAQKDARAKLVEMRIAKVAAEAEAVRLAAERAENERVAAENAATAARLWEEGRAAREEQEAARVERERLDGEAAAARAEADRIAQEARDAEAAELDRQRAEIASQRRPGTVFDMPADLQREPVASTPTGMTLLEASTQALEWARLNQFTSRRCFQNLALAVEREGNRQFDQPHHGHTENHYGDAM